jgi:hydrogenase maturation protease
MNLAAVEKIAKAVLYEGYMLYPYRPSAVKNQRRWNFGVLCPKSYSDAQDGTEASIMQTECLVEGSSISSVEVRLRFLQLSARSIGQLTTPVAELMPGDLPPLQWVEKFEVNGRMYQAWQDAAEREVIVSAGSVEALASQPMIHHFGFHEQEQIEPLRDSDGRVGAILLREARNLSGEVEVSVAQPTDGTLKLTIRISNITPVTAAASMSRETALLHSLVSAHTILGVTNGAFVSLLAPPEQLREYASSCKNVGTWPVLVGEEGQRDTMLSSPIILYDYPEIAPESAGDLFDGTEIDEILSLRIMTLTDEEKVEMRQSDERARQMLERTETMPVEQFMKLHGALRGLRPLKEKEAQ